MVDGGLLSNFPLELFVSDAPPVTAVMGRKTADHALGLFIDKSLPVAGAPERPQALCGARRLPSLDASKPSTGCRPWSKP
jgi:predicted acylesterase/phospholipase RssA